MNTLKVTTPTGAEFEIREATGADDDVLSNVTLDEAGVVNKYLAGIVIKDSKGKNPTVEDIERLLLRDKYTLLIKSRIFSLGKMLIFSYDWQNEEPPVEYEVDLSDYVWEDYDKFPEEGSDKYFKERIGPYKVENLNLMLGDKEVKMDILNGFGERYLLELPPVKRTINTQLLARNLSMQQGDEWKKIVSFMSFPSRDIVKLREIISVNYPDNAGLVEVLNPQT